MNSIPTQIVLISGKQGSGKTSLQKALVTENTSKAVLHYPLNFADPLYKMHDAVLEILEEYGVKRDIKKDGPLLQVIGTEWGRKTVGENVWLDLCKNAVANLKQKKVWLDAGFSKLVIVISDCRFQNEFNGFPEALRVRLECPKEIRRKRCEMWRDKDSHPSEIDLDGHLGEFDMIFRTDSESVQHCATMIEAQLLKNNWIEKRNQPTKDQEL